MNGVSLTIFCVTFLNMSVQRNHHHLRNGGMHLPRATAPMVKSTKAFLLKKVLTSSLVMSSTFFLAFRERSWMSSRILCTRLRERGFSPLLLVMAAAVSYLSILCTNQPSDWTEQTPSFLNWNFHKRGKDIVFYICTASVWMHVSAHLNFTRTHKEKSRTSLRAVQKQKKQKKKTKQDSCVQKQKHNAFWLAGVPLIS